MSVRLQMEDVNRCAVTPLVVLPAAVVWGIGWMKMRLNCTSEQNHRVVRYFSGESAKLWING